jgi:hypothetical protein
MLVLNYIILFLIVFSLAVLYQKYLEKKAQKISIDSYDEIRKYLLNESDLAKSKKPILWIHIPYEYNSRRWSSFGSRSSTDLNQPYLYLTVKTIIKCCDKSFKICIIDDNTFEKIIPGWSIDMSKLADPILKNVRQLGISELIYNYGGVNVPISFLCWRDLIDLYEDGTRGDKMFICENVDRNITSTTELFYPDVRFMGAKKNNNSVKEFINKVQEVITRDYTAQSEFIGDLDRWCNDSIKYGKINLIRGVDVGTRTIDGEQVTLDNLLSQEYIHFYGKMYGIWIPSEDILKRVKYEWFARMSPEQIIQGDFILAKYIILSLAPDSMNGVIEPLANNSSSEDWIAFWRVPISSTLPLFGPMPQNLGNNVPKYNF